MTPADVHAWLHERSAFYPWIVLTLFALIVDFAIDRSGFDDWIEKKYAWGRAATHTATRLPMVIFFSSFSAITLGRADVADFVFGAVCGLAGPLLDAIRKGRASSESLLCLLGLSAVASPLAFTGCALFESEIPRWDPGEPECIAGVRREYGRQKEICGARRDAECSTDALIEWKTAEEIKCTEKF